jgi:hypothetical protein
VGGVLPRAAPPWRGEAAAVWLRLNGWIDTDPILVIAGAVFALMLMAFVLGAQLRRWRDRAEAPQAPGRRAASENTAVAAVLSLLALLLGFSFNLAMERFEARRLLVVDDASAIDTAYLRAQLLPDPYRQRLSDILLAYTDNKIALGAYGVAHRPDLLAKNDALLTDLWAATSAALANRERPDLSTPVLAAMNRLTELDVSNKEARLIHVPSEIFLVLLAYLIVSAGLLGYVWAGLRNKLMSGTVLFLMTVFLLLVIDVDRPVEGVVREPQAPLELVRARLAAQPRSVFDRYKAPARVGRAEPAGRPGRGDAGL